MTLDPGSRIGILGGGQLGKMMALAAASLGYRTMILSNSEDSPAFHVADEFLLAPYEDKSALEKLTSRCDVVTVEFENIPYDTALYLEEKRPFRPGAKSLFIAQNRLREKRFAQSLGIETAPFVEVDDLSEAVASIGTPSILKTVEMGYDGKGQQRIDADTDLSCIQAENCILEGWVPFRMEISVVAARGLNGEFASFTPVQNIHVGGILDTTLAPAELEPEIADQAIAATRKLMEALEYVGVFAVEFFVTEENRLLFNEMAPRPHNSGHWTIDACYASQFEQHIRAICGLPLASPAHHHPAIMKNLIGEAVHDWPQLLKETSSKLHIYGKNEVKAGRKMGHVTTLQGSAASLPGDPSNEASIASSPVAVEEG